MTISNTQLQQWITEFQEKKDTFVAEFQNNLFNHPDAIELLAYENNIVKMLERSVRPSFYAPLPQPHPQYEQSDTIEWLRVSTSDLLAIHDAFLKVYPDHPVFDNVALEGLKKANALRCLFDVDTYDTTTVIEHHVPPQALNDWVLVASAPWVSDLLELSGYDRYGLEIGEKLDSLIQRSARLMPRNRSVQIGGYVPTIQRSESLGVLARFNSEHGDAGQVYVEAKDSIINNESPFASHDEMY